MKISLVVPNNGTIHETTAKVFPAGKDRTATNAEFLFFFCRFCTVHTDLLRSFISSGDGVCRPMYVRHDDEGQTIKKFQ